MLHGIIDSVVTELLKYYISNTPNSPPIECKLFFRIKFVEYLMWNKITLNYFWFKIRPREDITKEISSTPSCRLYTPSINGDF